MELLNRNAVNQIPKGTVIFKEGEKADCVVIVLRGRIQIKNRGSNVVAGVGTFFGISDVAKGRYQSSYITYDDVIVATFEMKELSDVERIASENKDYGGLMVTSQGRYIKELERIETLLRDESRKLFEFLLVYSKKCMEIGKKSGYFTRELEILKDLTPEEDANTMDEEYMEYNRQCCTVPIPIMKEFFSNNIISMYHITRQIPYIDMLIKKCTDCACYIFELFMALFSRNEECLFQIVIDLLKKVKGNQSWKDELAEVAEICIEKINAVEKMLHDELDRDLNVDHDYLEQIYFQILSGDFDTKQPAIGAGHYVMEDEAVLAELENSLEKLLRLADEDPNDTDDWKQLMQKFMHLPDKMASDDETRHLRKQLSQKYYDLYYKVFVKAYEKKDESNLVNLFLNYGLLDERLLSKEQLLMLYRFDKGSTSQESCCVYTMAEWLTEIYEGRKEPSKSEFDVDYMEYIRERKRKEKLSDAQVNQLKEDRDLKLKYELDNMLKYNNRISSGRIGVFVPFLYEDVFYGTMEKAFHTADEINASLNRLLSVDFSVFSREVLYYDTEKGIKKEYIVKKVFPDVILLPVCGSVGVMWQEIEGRRRDTSGRFLLPVLLEENLDDIMAQLFGRFRWEICRTVQGTAWNNVQYPSLTSEYYDYIQFYQKNRELTPEKKEKLKSQISKGRSNMREVFLIDYIAWVTREYRGEVRLNKVARTILATYVPFRQDIREKLAFQPMFQEAINRYEHNRNHTIKEMELRVHALEKERIEIPEVITETIEYWKES